jgi:hypothetical protein
MAAKVSPMAAIPAIILAARAFGNNGWGGPPGKIDLLA